ncbi:sodium/hydrogen exchanger 9-like isoform X2 [Notolabrus celidotus]|uniref:sodium/hydrogen exchanger 9-like isoform X2 n=1 Tax=Notolabrus celidotus TaxID=1203425 RepID=UPI00149033DF|nr:sodium/hydrogen exchanger 9-like isoform X2 [Notolabrus celidotus]
MTSPVKHRHDNTAVMLLAAVGLALITILSVWKLKQFKYRLIHETGGAMFYGMLVGLTVRYLSSESEGHLVNMETVYTCGGLNSTPHILTINVTSHSLCFRHIGKVNGRCPTVSTPHMETFDPEVLFNLFLPPIIFHGAYTLNQRRFGENLGSIVTFAFLGTIISCIIMGACVFGFTRLMVLVGSAADGDFFLTDCLLFGAILSATDPVSVLGLLSGLHVDVDLHTLLFGESVLNDAVAIILTHAIVSYSQMDQRHSFNPLALLLSVGYFLWVLVGSFLLGFTFAVITALLTKYSRLCDNPLLETSVVFLLSWSSFLSAEACGLSGIVAVLFCGFSQARYTVHNLSDEGKTRTKQLFEVSNFLGEIFIFSYMGYVLLTSPHHVFKALFISGAFLSIFISRACNIYPLSFLLNLRRRTKIPRSFQHFMMLTGLRGAVAFSLAARDTTTEVRRTIFTTTLLLVGFTVWVLGAAADPMLHCLDIRAKDDAEENPEDLSFEVATGRPDTTQGLWHRLDCKYLKPLLTHHGPPLTDSLPRCCVVFGRFFSSMNIEEEGEQLCEAEADDSTCDLEKSEHQLASIGGDSASEYHEDLLEGDLGLGTAAAAAAPSREG